MSGAFPSSGWNLWRLGRLAAFSSNQCRFLLRAWKLQSFFFWQRDLVLASLRFFLLRSVRGAGLALMPARPRYQMRFFFFNG
jgi:hypothetical protein